MDDLRSEVRELAGLGVGHARKEDRVRHVARIGGEDAVHVGPDVDLRGLEQRAEDRARVVAAVAAERGASPLPIAGDEARHDEPRGDRAGQLRLERGAGLHPVDVRAERVLVDDEQLACVEPGARRVPRAQVRVEQLRAPHLAEPRDELEEILRDCADLGLGAQHRVQRLEGCTQLVEQVAADRVWPAVEQGPRRGVVAQLQLAQIGLPGRLARGGLLHQGDERVGDALHGRDHDHLTLAGAREQEIRHMPDARAIGDAGSAELVGDGGQAHRRNTTRVCCRARSEAEAARRRRPRGRSRS